MNFKDLESVDIGTILLDQGGDERYFDGFNRKGNVVKTESVENGVCLMWQESEIKKWTIKKPEFKPEKLGRLYMTTIDLNAHSKGDLWVSNFVQKSKAWKPVTVDSEGNVWECDETN